MGDITIGRSRIVSTIFFPRKFVFEIAYAAGTAKTIDIIVAMVDVKSVSRIAKRISFEKRIEKNCLQSVYVARDDMIPTKNNRRNPRALRVAT